MKKIKNIVIMIIICFSCTSCNGTITREIRHTGFTLSNTTFLCNKLTPKDDKDTNYEKIKYLNNSFLVTETGNLYELSLGQKYSNEQNCQKAEFSLPIVSIFDDKIVKANDGNFYYVVGQSNTKAYTSVTENDNSYSIYQMILGDENVVKVITIDQNTGIYYVLKNDGNIYQYTITRQDYQSNYQLVDTKIAYDSQKYGKIIDFNYSTNNILNTYIKTENKIYRMKIVNTNECSKYVDVTCKYELKNDEILEKYYPNILGYNGNLLITTYGKEFTVSS